jgi:hypothetical protein
MTKEQLLSVRAKSWGCELLKIEVEGARARLGLRHAGAGDEAKEANGRGLHFTSAGGLGVGGKREGNDVE